LTAARRGQVLALAGIVLFAFSLRSAVASLSPVIDHVQADFAVPAWVVGLISTAPPVCFAVFGLLAPQLERRLGLQRLSLLAIAVIAIGLVARGLATSSTGLLVSTAVIFAGVGTANILLPPLVKTYFPARIGLVTTLYSTTMAFSTFLPPLFAVPVADAAGWRFSLSMWAVFAVLAMVPWLTLLVVERRARGVARQAARASADAAAAAGGEAPASAPEDIEEPSPRVFGRLWRLPLTWALTVTFLSSSVIAYTSFGFLPQILIDTAGVTPATAGLLLSLFGAMGLPASLLVPVLVVRYRALPALFVVAITAGLAGIAGLLFAPTVAPWLWVALLGTTPLYFPLALVLLGLRARTHEGAIALSGFVQSIGYAIAACVPFAVGILHEATDSWTPALWLLAAVVATTIPAGFVLARSSTVEDEWERRHGAWR
jgi:CP family cyanate transporter-like MFS transporter